MTLHCTASGLPLTITGSPRLYGVLRTAQQHSAVPILHPIAYCALRLLHSEASSLRALPQEERIAIALAASQELALMELRSPASALLASLASSLSEVHLERWLAFLSSTKGSSSRTLEALPHLALGLPAPEERYALPAHQLAAWLELLPIDSRERVRIYVTAAVPKRLAPMEVPAERSDSLREKKEAFGKAQTAAKEAFKELRSSYGAVLSVKLCAITSSLLKPEIMGTASLELRTKVSAAWAAFAASEGSDEAATLASFIGEAVVPTKGYSAELALENALPAPASSPSDSSTGTPLTAEERIKQRIAALRAKATPPVPPSDF